MNTRKIVFSALFTALTCTATTMIKIPTPTMGYIHPGDALVLLSGLLLGPLWGGLSAGIGSMFADFFSGYLSYAPATFLIKALSAAVASHTFHNLRKRFLESSEKNILPFVAASGLLGEIIMVLGYFLFDIFLMAAATSNPLSSGSIAAGFTASLSGVPFNIIQGLFGMILSAILYPILRKNLRHYRES